jgi:hypothetical protein
MNVAEGTRVTAPQAAQRWLESFEAALCADDTAAAAALFLPDGLWRDILAFTWHIQTISGRGTIAATLQETLARTKPANFRILSSRTPPRWVSRAGTECIETLFEFDTTVGPCAGVARLVPDPQAPAHLRAWTLVTNLQEIRG